MNLNKVSVLAVDDDEGVLLALKLLLNKEVGSILTESNPEKILSILSKNNFDLVLLDMNFKSSINSGNEGLFWLKKIKDLRKNLPVILITAYGEVDIAVRAIKEGAADFILKPWRNENLIEAISHILNFESITKKGNLKQDAIPTSSISSNIIGQSEVMTDIFYKINKIAPTDANILILGENGTGKDLVAKEIFSKSLRKDKPFVCVDLGALTETLFESELFGHRKGAFTDAREDRIGRFEEADKGTIFLDEIANISLLQQSKLLSVLQNRQVTRLGSNTISQVDVRVISATNAPIYEMAQENKFRKDLIYRLNTIEIYIPPLRERKEDITLLANYFLKLYSSKYFKRGEIHFSKGGLEKLKNYSFPGNVRELQHTIERTVIMLESDIINEENLHFSSLENRQTNNILNNLPLNLNELEKSTIQKVIEKNNGNITKAAKELGITRTALYRRLGKHEI